MSPQEKGPPYPPTTAALGGQPTVSLDIPVTAVFLLLFVIGAVCHMTILQVNLRRGHKFLLSGMMFGFCMSRIVTMIMRIVWITRITNLKIAIAANVFVYAGVLLLFVINIVFSQRIVRALHPNIGWHPLFHHAFTAIYSLIVITLVMLVTSVIQSFYTLNANTKRIDRDILLYGQTLFGVISILPYFLVLGALALPRKVQVEKFGRGRFRAKIAYLLTTTTLLGLGAWFRAGTNFAGGERPVRDPAPYQSKACFYIFNFTVEIIVIFLYIAIRVDKRFYVPNKSKRPGDYSRELDFYARRKQGLEPKTSEEGGIGSAIAPEEVVFDNMSPEELTEQDKERGISEHGKAIPLEPVHPLHSGREQELSSKMPPTPAATPPLGEPLAPHGRVVQMSRD